MNKEFEVLARAWQDQVWEGASQKRSEEVLPEWIARLKKFEKRQLRANLAKTFALTSILVFLVWIIKTRFLPTPLTFAGLVLVLASSAVFMTVYLKMQFKVGALNLVAPAVDLISEARERLNGQKKLFKLYFPVFAFFLILGINLVLFDMNISPGVLPRLLHQLKITVPIVLAYVAAQRLRRIRFRKEIQPVIDHLSAAADDLRNNGFLAPGEAVE